MKRTLADRLRAWARAQWPWALGASLSWCAMLSLAGGGAATPAQARREATEWPREWQGQALQPLARSAVEARFAERFPGRIARFRLVDAGEELVLREVRRPTRMLHPAADCWRGIGWQIDRTQLLRDEQALLWRCFEASRANQRVRVCERIIDANGLVFTDSSAWFWAASLGQSVGPWQAVTRVRGL
jgi:hypothetical protein